MLDRSGKVLAYKPVARRPPARHASRGAEGIVETRTRGHRRGCCPINNHPLRAYATRLPHADSQQAAVLVVAVRRDHRDEALLEPPRPAGRSRTRSPVGDRSSGRTARTAPLRPVERYRAQAANIIAGEAGVRLQVPPDRDDEVTRLGHTLNATLDALEEALETERSFVNDASHELRTPLTVV